MKNELKNKAEKNSIWTELFIPPLIVMAVIVAMLLIVVATAGIVACYREGNAYTNWERAIATAITIVYIILNFFFLRGADDQPGEAWLVSFGTIIFVPVFSFVICIAGLFCWDYLSYIVAYNSLPKSLLFPADKYWVMGLKIFGFYTVLVVVMNIARVLVLTFFRKIKRGYQMN